MSDMVERVANELMNVHSTDIDHDEGLKIYYKMARAAIKAMREPTERMLEVGDHGTSREGWGYMIDEALK